MELTKSFEYGDVEITVKRSSGWDRLQTDTLWDKLGAELGETTNLRENIFRRHFARACTQTTVVKGLEWDAAKAANDPANGFKQWMDLDGELLEKWLETINEVDAPPGPHQLLPPHLLPETELADPK